MRRLIVLLLLVFLVAFVAEAHTSHKKKSSHKTHKKVRHIRRTPVEPAAVQPAFSGSRLHVGVSVAPQKYVIMKIAHSRVEVSVMVPSGSFPHTYDPKQKQITDMAASDMYMTIGDSAEQGWMDKLKAVNKDIKIVPMDAGIDKLDLDDQEKIIRNDPNGKDPHVWLDPVLMMTLAKNTAAALIDADPANKLYYQTNLMVFLNQLDAINKNMTNMFRTMKNRKFMVFHPSWAYFAKRYNLEQVTVQIDTKAPKTAEMLNIINTYSDNDMKIIFAQPQFSQRLMQSIGEETGAKVVIIDPLSENWAENLMKVAMLIFDNGQK